MRKKTPMRNKLFAIGVVICLLAGSAHAGEADNFNPFTGKKSTRKEAADKGKKQKTAAVPAAASPLPPPPPPLSSGPQQAGAVEPKQHIPWRVVGTVDGMVAVVDVNGAVRNVKDGDVLDNCVVTYPTIDCTKNSKQLKAQVAANKERDSLVTENAALLKQMKVLEKRLSGLEEKLVNDAKPVPVVKKPVEVPRPAPTVNEPPPQWFKAANAKRFMEQELGELEIVSEKGEIVAVRAGAHREDVLDRALRRYIRTKIKQGDSVYYQVSGLVEKERS